MEVFATKNPLKWRMEERRLFKPAPRAADTGFLATFSQRVVRECDLDMAPGSKSESHSKTSCWSEKLPPRISQPPFRENTTSACPKRILRRVFKKKIFFSKLEVFTAERVAAVGGHPLSF